MADPTQSGESPAQGETPEAVPRLRATLWGLTLSWRTSVRLTLAMAICTLAGGILPAAAAWVGKLIVDAVVMSLRELSGADAWAHHRDELMTLVIIEASIMALIIAAQRGQSAAQEIMRRRLANRVVELILEKATSLSLAQYEDPELHDRLMRARRDAQTRPMSLVVGTFTLVRNAVALLASLVLLAQLSWWAVFVVFAAGLPPFLAEVFFSGHAFEQQRRRSPEAREQSYLEALLSREDFAKEVKLYALATPIFSRYQKLARKLESEERRILVWRSSAGFVLTLLGTLIFYTAYAWIVRRTVKEHLTIGEMTMYLALFRQAQTGVSQGLASLGAMLDDHLYVRDFLAFLATPGERPDGVHEDGPDKSAGLVFEDVSFTYPGAERPTLDGVSFHIAPDEMVALVGQNGSGKTTLLKLLTRLYEPQSGRILLDGRDVREWNVEALRRRFALVLQDFVRFKLEAGENIGAGDAEHWQDEERWEHAGRRGLAHEFVSKMPQGYHTMLGKWFKGGQELSGGQWQKIALSRAFMRNEDQIMVLDEPAAALDPEAEQRIFEYVEKARGRQMVILVSHRFGSVRSADKIVVLERGRILEQGSHEDLVHGTGLYARLFRIQAEGFGDLIQQPPASDP